LYNTERGEDCLYEKLGFSVMSSGEQRWDFSNFRMGRMPSLVELHVFIVLLEEPLRITSNVGRIALWRTTKNVTEQLLSMIQERSGEDPWSKRDEQFLFVGGAFWSVWKNIFKLKYYHFAAVCQNIIVLSRRT